MSHRTQQTPTTESWEADDHGYQARELLLLAPLDVGAVKSELISVNKIHWLIMPVDREFTLSRRICATAGNSPVDACGIEGTPVASRLHNLRHHNQ